MLRKCFKCKAFCNGNSHQNGQESKYTMLLVAHEFCLKCIRNEIFDNDFIGPFESAFKDKTIAVYRLLISGLDPKL